MNNAGMLALERGEKGEAVRRYRICCAARPGDLGAVFNLCAVLCAGWMAEDDGIAVGGALLRVGTSRCV